MFPAQGCVSVNHPLWKNLFRPRVDHTTQLVSLWSRTPLFRGIPPRQCRELVGEMHSRRFVPGERVFSADDQGIGAIMLVAGMVEVRAGPRVLARLEPGDFFGEVALVSDEPRTADAVAVDASEVVFLLRPELEEWVARAPRHGARFMSNLAGVIAGRLRNANELLRDHHD